MSDEVSYLGFIINKDGISPNPDKIRDLLKANIPENVTQLKSFLRMLDYYHRHLSNLADTLEPLQKLLRKNIKWKLGEKQIKAFKKVKHLLCSEKLLLHHDPNKPLILACNASPYGLGAVL